MSTEQHADDGISGFWYLATILLPLVGIIAGIVFMAQNKIGPALALWATALVTVVVYLAVV